LKEGSPKAVEKERSLPEARILLRNSFFSGGQKVAKRKYLFVLFLIDKASLLALFVFIPLPSEARAAEGGEGGGGRTRR